MATLCKTITPRGIYFFCNGVRTNRHQFDALRGRYRQDSFRTEIDGETVRHFSCIDETERSK